MPVAHNTGLVLARHQLIGDGQLIAIGVNRAGQNIGRFAVCANLLKTELRI